MVTLIMKVMIKVSADIFPQVNDIAFHPIHFCLLSTVGSDGKFSFWDKDARTKLKV
jgi:mRNA export factor